MAQGEMTWTSGLIPLIDPESVAGIIGRIADLALVVTNTGIVQGVLSNPHSKLKYPFSRWEGQPLTRQLTVESIPKFEERLKSFLDSGGNTVRPVELNHLADREQREFPVRYSFHQLGRSGAILMLGQDLRPVAEMQQQLVAAQIALEKDYEAQREHDTRLRVLMSATRDGALFVSAATGEITDCNAAAVSLLRLTRGEVLDRLLPDLLRLPDGGNLLDTLSRLAGARTANEISVRTTSGRDLSLRSTIFRATGEQMLLCQLSDAQSVPGPADATDDHLNGLFERGADGIVFMAKSGTILSANEAFMRMSEVALPQGVRGRSMVDFLGRGSVDLNVISENASRTGTMRLYATRLVGENDGETPIEIATTLLNNGPDPVFALVIRDSSRAEMMRTSGSQITDVDMRSVIELIGSQTLKAIVAKTTDVIEKMCIETAVELTSNNRVAAAEMLGLSRQSLYVKLRKYDLLKKEMED